MLTEPHQMDKIEQEATPLNLIFVARQPILDRHKNIFGYELLFRSSLKNTYEHDDGDYATSKVLTNSFLHMGIDSITGGYRAFINFTRNLLLQETATAFPKDVIGVELLENIEPDEAVLNACRNLKKLGYIIILDDFVLHDKYKPLLEITDIVKIDFSLTLGRERADVIKEIGSDRITFLAEKVETIEDFNQAMACGYSYFQGYFFSKPEILLGRTIPGYKLNYLQLLHVVTDTTQAPGEIEKMMQRNVSLTHHFMQIIKSPLVRLHEKINSLHDAVSLLNIDEFRKWAAVIIIYDMGKDKPSELVRLSMMRAKFAELLAPHVGNKEQQSNLFFMGLFSALDAIMDKPMPEILDTLPVAIGIKTGLQDGQNIFRDVLHIVVSYYKGNWSSCSKACKKLGIDEKMIPPIYFEAVNWSNAVFQHVVSK